MKLCSILSDDGEWFSARIQMSALYGDEVHVECRREDTSRIPEKVRGDVRALLSVAPRGGRVDWMPMVGWVKS